MTAPTPAGARFDIRARHRMCDGGVGHWSILRHGEGAVAHSGANMRHGLEHFGEALEDTGGSVQGKESFLGGRWSSHGTRETELTRITPWISRHLPVPECATSRAKLRHPSECATRLWPDREPLSLGTSDTARGQLRFGRWRRAAPGGGTI